MKCVRMLLRVSSDHQLEADGDLSVQRQIIVEYVRSQAGWQLDEKEYFEGSRSAYKNTAGQREILQEILRDAARREFDILALYKDDRMGRLMWDTPVYIMELKKSGVDVYSVKDGCLSPDLDDITGQMMLAFRYANAQKSSADTGMRVKDTAVKLARRGKFLGGAAPYGYRLEYSGEISRHGRALKHLVIVPEQAEVVRYIYDLSVHKEFGSAKIAGILNQDPDICRLAPNDVWKAGTVTSILTNPVYTGRIAYKRRERACGGFHRQNIRDWIISDTTDETTKIIHEEVWNRVQEKRALRRKKYRKEHGTRTVSVLSRNDGSLPLLDVICCGHCGRKLTNGSRYSARTDKAAGEQTTGTIPVYRCQNVKEGVRHAGAGRFPAEEIEPPVFEAAACCIERVMEDVNMQDVLEGMRKKKREKWETALQRETGKLEKIRRETICMEEKLPEAMTGQYPLSLEELTALIKKQHASVKEIQDRIRSMQRTIEKNREEWMCAGPDGWDWKRLFLEADPAAKRVLIDWMIERIDVTETEIKIRWRFPWERNGGSGTIPYRPGLT